MFIVQKEKRILLADAEAARLEATLEFMPQYAGLAVKEVPDGSLEKGYDGQWYFAGTAPLRPSVEEVALLEAHTGLTRAVREIILTESSGVSGYIKTKAQEIEALALTLRQAVPVPQKETEEEQASAPEEAGPAETAEEHSGGYKRKE